MVCPASDVGGGQFNAGSWKHDPPLKLLIFVHGFRDRELS